ncbi:MAG: hypothetical protein JWR63_2098 [Conexibacter sp.]|nr:hypothetical protein [Conexibacter sp.]
MSAPDPRTFIEELTGDLDPADAVELAVELTRMIELGLLEVKGEGDDLRIGVPDDRDDDAEPLVA